MIRCIIIDDEKRAREILYSYVQKLDILELCGQFSNAYDATNYLQNNPVDLLFLDINMPEVSGLEMLQAMDRKPMVILTTAYSQFALEGYDMDVVDYLLKPIPFPRFAKAVEKAARRTHQSKAAVVSAEDRRYLTVKNNQELERIPIGTILFLQAWGNYLKIVTSKGNHLIRETLLSTAGKLPPKQFLQIHRSYIVNLDHVQKISGNRLILEDMELPIGQSYKLKLMRRLDAV